MTGAPDTLYYYCTSSIFQNLIERPEVWLTELRGSNDSKEGSWAIECYLNLFERHKGEDWLKAKVVLEELFQSRTALGFCVSESGDLLSQWRGHADNGRGICIGFNADMLRDAAQKSSMELHKICYGDPTIDGADFVMKMHDGWTQNAIKISIDSAKRKDIH